MNWAVLLPLLQQTIEIATRLVQAGLDAAPAIAAIRKIINQDAITDADLDALQAVNDALHEQLQAPLPPDDGTTTT